MNSSPYATRLGAIALCCCAAHVRDAWAICVSSDTEFATAAIAALFAPVDIQLVQGTYHIDGTAFDVGTHAIRTFQGLSLLGGYTPGTNCTSRQIDPANTIITRSGSNASFSADLIGDVTVEGIAFRGAGSGVILYWGYNTSGLVPDSVNALIRRNIFAGAGSADDEGLGLFWLPLGSQTLSARLVENLVHGNGDASSSVCSASSRGAVFLQTYTNASASFTLNNNTVVNNGAGCGVSVSPSANLTAYNNIFYGNTGPELFTGTQVTSFLVDNVIDSHVYDFPPVFQMGTLTSDPKLTSTFHPIESPPSPVINSGANVVPGGLPANDLDGSPRVVGSTVDRGVYESNVDDAFRLHVTNTNDSGSGSLREAIKNANNNGGFNIIDFAIGSGCGPHVITLASDLPDVKSSVRINGYTQPGASENDLDVGDDATICIVLEGGTSNLTISNGFNVPASAPGSTKLHVEGIAFSGFKNNAAVHLAGGSDHIVEGIHIGGSVGGVSLAPVSTGVSIYAGVSGVTVGGDDNRSRNIIGDADYGVGISVPRDSLPAAHDNQIINNYIGVGWSKSDSAFTNRGNSVFGIVIGGPNNTISNNIFGFNNYRGIGLGSTESHDNNVTGNFIGISPLGDDLGKGPAGLGSGQPGGVDIGDDAHDNTIAGNVIADNEYTGIAIESGQHNLLRANSIYNNGHGVGTGIDLGGIDGPTPNDNDSTPPAGDPPNRYQNFPVLTGAIGGHTKGMISGTLTSTPGDYRIEFFASPACDASGYGEGETYLGHTTITLPNLTANGQTTVSFSKSVQSFFLQVPGEVITATATAQAAGVANDTSEFSACFPYTDDTIFANGYEQTFLF
jgi:parallel beta-helix repeat protein